MACILILSAQPRPQVRQIGGKRLSLGSTHYGELHRANMIQIRSRPGGASLGDINCHLPHCTPSVNIASGSHIPDVV